MKLNNLKHNIFDDFKNQTTTDFYTLSKQENEYRINRISGVLDLFVLFCCAVMYLFNVLGIFILDSDQMLWMTLIMAPFALTSFVVGTVLKVESPWIKYLIIVDECVCVLLAFTVLSMHVVLVLSLPLLKAALYFDKKVTVTAFILSSVSMLIGHITSVYFSIVFDDPIKETLLSSLVYGFVPRFVEYIVIFVFVLFLTQNSARMQLDGYEYAEKTKKLLEENRTNHYEIVKNLATISENKSADNGGHIQRVFEYMQILAKHAGFDEEAAYNIGLAAMLHDVGKLGVSEEILSKPARLTEEEFNQVKKHSEYGKQLLSGSENEVLKLASVIADQHHERWDGKGYNGGLRGEEINKFSCMMSVVDVFDALASKRCYKEPWDIDDVYNEIVNGKGTQFSPETVDMFCECFEEFKEVYNRIKDN